MNIKIKNLRCWIAVLLASVTALNYLDRQSLPVLIKEIQKTFPISDVDDSYLQIALFFAYFIKYSVVGRIMDLLWTRIRYTFIIIWRSIANMLQGFVSSVLGFGVVRFFLGIGKGGSLPDSAKVVSVGFPPTESSFALGIFNTGSRLRSVIA